MPCRTTVPLHTASSGVPPGAEMSTPSSSDHVPGGDTSPLGIGNSNPWLDGALGGGPLLPLPELDEPEEPDEDDEDDEDDDELAAARSAAARRAACSRLSC